MDKKIMKVSAIRSNGKNPRKIAPLALDKLKKSIQEFPEMLDLRPIVVNRDGLVLGGNMRLKAMRELGIKECPVIVADNITEAQEREFVIKDNVSGGEWDWEMLESDDWSDLPLDDWGLDLPPIVDFEPGTEEEQGRLDQLEPKYAICPYCGKEFDLRENGQI